MIELFISVALLKLIPLAILSISSIIFFSLSYQSNTFSDLTLRESLFGTIAMLTGTGYVLGDYEIWPVFLQMILLFDEKDFFLFRVTVKKF